MSDKIVNTEEHIPPIRLTDNMGVIKNPGDVYELDFSRESVLFAESKGFQVDNVLTAPVTLIPVLFYISFRKNHKAVSREKTDKYLKTKWDWKIPQKVLTRLINLYNQALLANSIDLDDEDEDAEKNALEDVEL